MYRFVLTAAVLALLVAGCGSDADGSGSSPAVSASKSPKPAYFQQAQSDEINKAAAPTIQAAGAATDPKNIKKCNRVELLPAWRRCWHKLLDPMAESLNDLSAAFDALSAKTFPESCVTELEGAARTFSGDSGAITALIAGYDSKRAAARTKAANSYATTLDKINGNFQKPFYSVTKACYSPEVLASLNASPSPSASPSP